MHTLTRLLNMTKTQREKTIKDAKIVSRILRCDVVQALDIVEHHQTDRSFNAPHFAQSK